MACFFPHIGTWTKSNGNAHECMEVHVDDLAFVINDLNSFAKVPKEKHEFKLKCTGAWSFCLGAPVTLTMFSELDPMNSQVKDH